MTVYDCDSGSLAFNWSTMSAVISGQTTHSDFLAEAKKMKMQNTISARKRKWLKPVKTRHFRHQKRRRISVSL